jgi:hypothetical protein
MSRSRESGVGIWMGLGSRESGVSEELGVGMGVGSRESGVSEELGVGSRELGVKSWSWESGVGSQVLELGVWPGSWMSSGVGSRE